MASLQFLVNLVTFIISLQLLSYCLYIYWLFSNVFTSSEFLFVCYDYLQMYSHFPSFCIQFYDYFPKFVCVTTLSFHVSSIQYNFLSTVSLFLVYLYHTQYNQSLPYYLQFLRQFLPQGFLIYFFKIPNCLALGCSLRAKLTESLTTRTNPLK